MTDLSGNIGVYPDYAGFWRRHAAVIIDGLLISISSVLISLVVGLAFGFAAATFPRESEPYQLIMLLSRFAGYLLGFGLTVAYYGYFETHHNGASLGRKALGIALQTRSGEPVTLKQSMIRQASRLLSSFLLCIGFLIQPFNEHRQALHDLMTGCVVVRTRSQAVWVPWAINLGVLALWVIMLIVFIVGVVLVSRASFAP